MTQMNLDVLLRTLELEQTEFLKGVYRFEPCWLEMQIMCTWEIRKYLVGKVKKSQTEWITKIGGKAVWGRIWQTLGICVCFSLEIG